LRIVALSSGGVDSSVMIQLLKRENDTRLFPLFVDYGQLAAHAEWEACQRVCQHFNLKPDRIDVHGFGHLIPSGLTDRNLDIEKEAFLPARNLLFLTLGAAYGYAKSAHTIAIGLISNPIFPDQTIGFVKEAQRTISMALGVEVAILAPLISLDKVDSLRLARKNRLPLEFTYSCHSGNKTPCGQCVSCKERIAAEKWF